MDEVDLLDKLCDELDSRGIEGNVIERDILNGNPYVVIWPGKFEDRATALTEELFFVHICADRYYEVLPSAKYRRYFGERFYSCRSEKRGYYIMTFLRLVDTIEYLFKKENNMNNSRTEAIRELCHIIALATDTSLLRWTAAERDSIFIHKLTNSEKVCRVQVYNTTSSPINACYYLYFYNKKYRDIAKEIKDPNLITVTEGEGYKFNLPCHVFNFVNEIVKLEERGGVLKDCKTEVVDRMERTMANTTYGVLTTLMKNFAIEDVIFNDPATIIIWADGSKTVVKAENEEFDPEKGLAMAISKKVLGNKYDYYDVFKKYVGRYEKKQKKGKK